MYALRHIKVYLKPVTESKESDIPEVEQPEPSSSTEDNQEEESVPKENTEKEEKNN